MDRTSADAFVYAKACGLYARSFVGIRARKLFAVKRLQALWSLLFDEDVPLVPEGMLALLIERKSGERIVSRFRELVSFYDKPDPVSLALLSLYDFNNLKAAASAVALGIKEKPFMLDLGAFSIINKNAWPDIAAMTRGGPLSWYDSVPDIAGLLEREIRLDHEYYRSVWMSLRSLGQADREATEGLVKNEIILQNIVWAMRLKVYYGKTNAEIVPMLASARSATSRADELTRPAISVLSRAPDSWTDWQGWNYSWLLNPHEEGAPWTLDPRWAQQAADRYLYRLALHQFHGAPFTPGTLVAFFKILQLEEQMIRVASEGIRLGATETQMHDFMGDIQNV